MKCSIDAEVWVVILPVLEQEKHRYDGGRVG